MTCTTARVTLLAAAAGLVLVSGCADADRTGSASAPAAVSAPTGNAAPGASSTEPSASPAGTPTTAMTPAAEPSAEPAPLEPMQIDVTIASGEVTTATDRIPVEPGDTIRISVSTDAADELHIHAVDESMAVEPGADNVLELTLPSDIVPGLYVAETHHAGLTLFTLVVS